MSVEEEMQLLTQLTELLEKQLDRARRGSFTDMERLAAKCEPLVEKITQARLLERPEYKVSREHLAELYHQLQLVLSAQKNVTAEKLGSIRKSKRVVSAYRDNAHR